MKRIRGSLALVAALTALLPAPRLLGVEEFYLSRLREGQQSLAERRFLDAATEFRIACFGLLEDPPLLSNCLAGLALAQEQAGKPPEEVDATIRRFIDLERRFSAFGKAPLNPAMQTAFADMLRKRVSSETLATLPPASTLFESEDQKFAKLPPAERVKAYEARAAKEPTNPKWPQVLMTEQLAAGDSKAAIRWATRSLELVPDNPDALIVRGRALTQRKDYAKAKADLAAVPPETRARVPEASADLVIAAATVKDWVLVTETAKSLPEELASRPDVKAAIAKVPVPKATPASAAVPPPVTETPPPPIPTRAAEAAPSPASGPASVAVAPVPAPSPVPPPATPPPTAKKSSLEEGRELLRSGKTAEAKALFKEAVQAAPADRDARKALLEASVLTRDWKLGIEQLPVLEPLSDQEAPFLFYASVCLYENGDAAKARDYLRRARPRIAASPFVDYYSKKILPNP